MWGVGSMPGLKVHCKGNQGKHLPHPPHRLWVVQRKGAGDMKEKGRGEERMTNTGEKQIESKEALAAAEGIKWDMKGISQLGSMPTKKFSLLSKKKNSRP